MTNRWTTSLGWMAPALLGATFLMVGCETQGPAEKAGEHIDNAAEEIRQAGDPRTTAEKVGDAVENTGRKVEDAITTPGPAEKAGRAIDDATSKP